MRRRDPASVAGLIARWRHQPTTKPEFPIFLGDVIDRGPQSMEALSAVSVERLMGNHEQLLLLAVGGDIVPAQAGRDPHVIYGGRLDAGSAQSGIVVGGQIESGRYRVVKAMSDTP